MDSAPVVAQDELRARVGASSEERVKLLLAFAQALYVNGQSTATLAAAVGRLGATLGLTPRLLPRWGELRLEAEEGGRTLEADVAADPTGVNMARVAAATRVMADLEAGRLAPAKAVEAIAAAARTPAAPDWQFALAAAVGAVALAIIFGIEHTAPAVLIFLSAGLGAFLRRFLARYSDNALLQPFCAALLAGLIGGLAVRYDLSSSLRLVAVCPCMVLVPGPHLLNGADDLIEGRVHLGATRFVFAGLVITSIAVGLLLGLSLLGASLPIDEPGRSVPLWFDVIAAGIAVACYSVFFSTPLGMLGWPVMAGMLAHALRWFVLADLHANLAIGAGVAAVLAALILTPVARRTHMPFAAIGFAAVVSMMPGVYLFRMAAGLMQLIDSSQPGSDLVVGTLGDGAIALTITLALGVGLVVPKLLVDRLAESRP